MSNTIETRSRRSPLLKLGLSLLASCALAVGIQAQHGAGVGGSGLFASGLTYSNDFDQNGRPDYRSFSFYVLERSDGSIGGQALLRITIDDLDGDGAADIDPIRVNVRVQIDDAVRMSATDIVVTGVVSSTDFPVPCPLGYSVGTQVGFVAQDNGSSFFGPTDLISPLVVWDCIPFDPADYGLPSYTSGLAHFLVEYGPPPTGEFFPPTPVADNGGFGYVEFLRGQLSGIDFGGVVLP